MLKKEGIIPRLWIARRVNPLNHAQFDDDTIIMESASVNLDKHFKSTWDLFLSASRGKSNLEKRCVYGWNYIPKNLREIYVY